VRRGGSGSANDADGAREFSQVERDLDLLPPTGISHEDLVDAKLDMEARIQGLEDRSLREIARLMSEGYSQEEIAARTGLRRRTVCRKLQRLRIIWKDLDPGQ
jgi:DNA-directed RNA polymerase specialized sigma24 family protein